MQIGLKLQKNRNAGLWLANGSHMTFFYVTWPQLPSLTMKQKNNGQIAEIWSFEQKVKLCSIQGRQLNKNYYTNGEQCKEHSGKSSFIFPINKKIFITSLNIKKDVQWVLNKINK